MPCGLLSAAESGNSTVTILGTALPRAMTFSTVLRSREQVNTPKAATTHRMRCNQCPAISFYQPNINFNSSYTYFCPFEDSDLCVKGAPAVTFDTGLVEASSLGINAAPEDIYKFRRSSTCVPLNVDFPYVKTRDRNGTTVFDYYYGQISDDDYSREATLTSLGSPFDV